MIVYDMPLAESLVAAIRIFDVIEGSPGDVRSQTNFHHRLLRHRFGS